MNKMQINRTKTYFRNNMSPSRRLEFEAELDNNPELKKEYLIYKAIHSDIKTMSQISDAISDPNIDEAFKLADEAIAEFQQKTRKEDLTIPTDPTPQIIDDPIKIISTNKNKTRRIYFYLSSPTHSRWVLFPRRLRGQRLA